MLTKTFILDAINRLTALLLFFILYFYCFLVENRRTPYIAEKEKKIKQIKINKLIN